MADTRLQPAPESVEDEAAPRGKRKKLVLVAVVVAALVAGGWFVLGGDQGEAPAPVEGEVVEVAQMTINLADESPHYVRLGFAVVLREGVVPGDVEGRFALLRDAALTEVQGFTSVQLRSVEGMEALREQLGSRADEVWPGGEVIRVVLTELLVQ